MSLRAWLPREHGLWAWVGLPLIAALALTPRALPAALAVLAAFLVANRLRGRLPRTAWIEVPGIVLFAIAGGFAAVSGGADVSRAIAAESAVAAWLVLGLWWVRSRLQPVLPARSPWRAGPMVAAGAVACSLAIGIRTGHPFVGAVPLLYAARHLATRPVGTPRDARRVGFSELGWGLAATCLAVTL